ncbi:Hypothetical protein I595_2826 [Croceitalea dokdonensis DOKDO 023]|uniref:Uncharacterized protein n=1 Tax=Croceitalea dokdonensis DOKDO 023 TaxID=1300341 RepID=A0A0P7ASL3_9FLAO|nr:Hypothetical protein I595_2826 [Croceitalea dokdonensis DOKDO 023]
MGHGFKKINHGFQVEKQKQKQIILNRIKKDNFKPDMRLCN